MTDNPIEKGQTVWFNGEPCKVLEILGDLLAIETTHQMMITTAVGVTWVVRSWVSVLKPEYI